jgi:glycosyltransferase involved in cell wall biosynthesis
MHNDPATFNANKQRVDIFVSVIIPTRNRCESLRDAIVSLQRLNYPNGQYEIIVIDNNSTDDTRRVVEECKQQGKKEIIYFKELRDGLHNARHAGARIAKGDIFAYIDDDVLCDPEWLSELTGPYSDPNVACVGGKILPRYETKEPDWAKCIPGFLSILDRGSEIQTVNDAGIWGCNFSVRKSVLYEIGGFHPDAMPWNLIRYRGDGETGLLNKAVEKGYDVVYTPLASVTHIIPNERVRLDYFKKRAFFQGISDSYTEIRNKGGLAIQHSSSSGLVITTYQRLLAFLRRIRLSGFRCAVYFEIALKCSERGAYYHRSEVLKDKKLLEFILQKDYLDKALDYE